MKAKRDPGEIWKDVSGYEEIYRVSNLGRAKSFHYDARNGQVLKTQNGTYPQVTLCRGGNREQVNMHCLVSRAFLGPAPSPDHEINHKNGNKYDNHIENLEWVTRSENEKHAYRILGKEVPRGEAHKSSKLTRYDVQRIRILYTTGQYSHRKLGKMFRINHRAIGRIIRRERWRHVL